MTDRRKLVDVRRTDENKGLRLALDMVGKKIPSTSYECQLAFDNLLRAIRTNNPNGVGKN